MLRCQAVRNLTVTTPCHTRSGGADIPTRPKRERSDSGFPPTPRDESYVHGTTTEYKRIYPWLDESAMAANLAVHASYFAVHEAGIRLINSFGRGRTGGRFSVLRALFLGNRRMTQNEIAGRLMITSASVTFLIDGLEKEGLVARETNEFDRRSTDVVLMPKGVEVCERLIPAMAHLAAGFCRGFTEEEKQTFLGFLMRFWHNALDVLEIDPDQIGAAMSGETTATEVPSPGG